MLSPVLFILIQLISASYQLETIQIALAGTTELPCSAGLNIESTNPGKVSALRDKCLHVRVQFVIVEDGRVLFKEAKNKKKDKE